jgi:Na+-transporting NADH:ubiquinone oxidoreductase subunit C
MAFDKNSNQFTFLFSIILVSVVGIVLAMTYMALKPSHVENVRREKMQNILQAMNINVARDEAPAMYEEVITEAFLVDHNGQRVEGDAFNMDVLMQFKNWRGGEIKLEEKLYPVYVGESDGQSLFVLPMVGTGLWGPVWGYVSVQDDGRTIFGSTFDHKGETPGLGAEIATPVFENRFPGKTFTTDAGEFRGITVYKGGTNTTDPHGVDGISGGTITSQGVDEMLKRTLAVYDRFLQTVVQGGGQTMAPADQVEDMGTASLEQDGSDLNTLDQ